MPYSFNLFWSISNFLVLLGLFFIFLISTEASHYVIHGLLNIHSDNNSLEKKINVHVYHSITRANLAQ